MSDENRLLIINKAMQSLRVYNVDPIDNRLLMAVLNSVYIQAQTEALRDLTTSIEKVGA